MDFGGRKAVSLRLQTLGSQAPGRDGGSLTGTQEVAGTVEGLASSPLDRDERDQAQRDGKHALHVRSGRRFGLVCISPAARPEISRLPCRRPKSHRFSLCVGKITGSIPRSGGSPGGGHGIPLQDSCLENPTDRGAWWATVRGVAKSQTGLSD